MWRVAIHNDNDEISLVKRETAINITESETDKVRLKTEINDFNEIDINKKFGETNVNSIFYWCTKITPILKFRVHYHKKHPYFFQKNE